MDVGVVNLKKNACTLKINDLVRQANRKMGVIITIHGEYWALCYYQSPYPGL